MARMLEDGDEGARWVVKDILGWTGTTERTLGEAAVLFRSAAQGRQTACIAADQHQSGARPKHQTALSGDSGGAGMAAGLVGAGLSGASGALLGEGADSCCPS